jgi:hypothetical protein
MLSQIPEDAESIRLNEKQNDDGTINSFRIGRLKNYGLGPGLSTHVVWMPRQVWLGSELFEINAEKLKEPIYSSALNTMPSDNAHILSGEETGLTRLPTFIEKDFEKKISRVEGILIIKTTDVFGMKYSFSQEFTVFTNYSDERPWFHVTFGDLLIEDK